MNNPRTSCTVEGCKNILYYRGLCQRHYRLASKGDLEFPEEAYWARRSKEPYPDGTKICSTCGQEKELAQYGRRTGRKDHLVASRCRECLRVARQHYVSENSDKILDQKYRRDYNISLDQYNAMLAEQDGKCALCHGKSDIRLAVDHDRNCCPGRKSCGSCVRKLLCRRCNQTLGLIEENAELLQRMIDYVAD